MNNKLLGWLLFTLVLCVGCAHQAHDEDAKSSEDIAVINDSYTGSMRSDRAQILAVDGDNFGGSKPEQVEVLPGKHSVTIYCWHGYLDRDRHGLQGRVGSVDIDVQAGHEYKVFCSTSNGRYVRWIVDLATDEIVGGKSQ
jgi:hypothetical protein